MKNILLIAGLSGCLFAEPGIKGPTLGYVSSGTSIRSVLGLTGASQLTSPLVVDLQKAIVLPGTSVAAAVNANGMLVRIDLTDGTISELDVADVMSLTSSPSGEMFLAVAGGRAHVFSKSGERSADLAIPGSPIRIAVADRDSVVAVTVAESDGEALHILNEQGSTRLLFSSRLPAIAFLPNSADVVVSDETGVVSRVGSESQFRRVATAPGAHALAVTTDHSRLLIVAGQTVRAVRLASGEETSIDCSCAAVMALPLGGSNFLLTKIGDGPIWLVDLSADELRLAFIPEAVNE